MVMTWEIGLCHGGISLKPTRVMLTGLTCLAVAAMLLRRYFHLADHAYPLLMVASAGFVSLASLAVVRRRSFLRWAVLIGLVLCWLLRWFLLFPVSLPFSFPFKKKLVFLLLAFATKTTAPRR